MYKLMLVFLSPDDTARFQQDWQRFLRLAEAMPGLRKETVSHVEAILHGTEGIYMQHNLYFDSRDDLEFALRSDAGQEAAAFLRNFAEGRVTILLAEHKEASAEDFRRSRP